MASNRRAPASPPHIPGFTYQRLLGSGGFSDVFLYQQELPRRNVAVKVLLGGEELQSSNREAFIGEANVMAQMSSHPYILTIFHAAVAEDGRAYFVMEYAPGRSLSERYKTEVLSIEEVLRTGIRIASAVATAHSAGILHRDIKPANILANEYGWPVLTDFGISSAVDDELNQAVTETGTTSSAGMSVPWSPPEMFDDVPRPDVRSEVFSLTATVYTIVAGHTPFEIPGRPNGTIDLMGRIERGQITPIERPDVPRSLVAVLHRGMSVRPGDRYQTAVEFARALQSVEMELGYPATPIDVPTMHVQAPARPSAEAVGEDVDEDATSVRSASAIRPEGVGAASPAAGQRYGGHRPDDPERTSARSIARIEAMQRAASGPGIGTPPAAVRPTGHEVGNGPSGDALAEVPTTALRSTPIIGTVPGSPASGPAGATAVGAERPEAFRPVFERHGGAAGAGSSIEDIEDTAGDQALAAFRGRGKVTSTSAAAPEGRQRGDVEDPYADSKKPKNTNLIVGILVGLIVVLLAALTVVGGITAMNSGKQESTSNGAKPGANKGAGQAQAQGFPPAPVAPVSVRSPDGMITFKWDNPDPQNGDVFFWQLADGSQPGKTTTEPKAVVGPSNEGVKVCIKVELRRNGKTSAEKLTACYPQ